MEAYGTATTRPLFQPRRMARMFTIEQADRALPLVRPIVRDVVNQHRVICDLEDLLQSPDRAGGRDEFDLRQEDYVVALERLRDLIDELSDVGCQLRDWRRGIVDFPAIRQGRLVELCWRLGERCISHWHEPDAGFGCRQRIEA